MATWRKETILMLMRMIMMMHKMFRKTFHGMWCGDMIAWQVNLAAVRVHEEYKIISGELCRHKYNKYN